MALQFLWMGRRALGRLVTLEDLGHTASFNLLVHTTYLTNASPSCHLSQGAPLHRSPCYNLMSSVPLKRAADHLVQVTTHCYLSQWSSETWEWLHISDFWSWVEVEELGSIWCSVVILNVTCVMPLWGSLPCTATHVDKTNTYVGSVVQLYWLWQ